MHPMLNIAIRAARRAGTIIVRGQQRLYEVQITRKGHQDYVTQIDKDAEAAIVDTLYTAYPDHQIIAEESGTLGGDSDYVWIVDPLDGTLNFMHGYQHFAVSIALSVRGRDYLYAEKTGLKLSNFKNELRGCGPFLHNDPGNRPPEVFENRVTLHLGPDHQNWVMVPIIPQA